MPDVAHDAAAEARPLDWVGMSNIALPLRVASAGGEAIQVAASVDIAVDLADAQARGIHMSRLYLQLQHAFASEVVTPAGLRRVLQTLIETQAGLSSRARLVLRYEQLLLRPALASGHAGWKSYPVEIEASLIEGHLRLALRFAIVRMVRRAAPSPPPPHRTERHLPPRPERSPFLERRQSR